MDRNLDAASPLKVLHKSPSRNLIVSPAHLERQPFIVHTPKTQHTEQFGALCNPQGYFASKHSQLPVKEPSALPPEAHTYRTQRRRQCDDSQVASLLRTLTLMEGTEISQKASS